MRLIETDYLIIGSGVAGLATALYAAVHGSVIVLAKDRLDNCNSTLAQGGIAAAVGKGDSPKLHTQDTLNAGAGICHPDTVKLLTSEAPEIIETLLELGTRFDSTDDGCLALAKEGAHSMARVLHHGDDTGAEIWQSLYRKINKMEQVTFMSETQIIELTVEEGRCNGANAISNTEAIRFLSKCVVLATGGAGQIYRKTTNSSPSTGEGLALAWQAGALLTDLEFMQFHPTALNLESHPLFLISEAVRGEGAVLINELSQRFMQTYHPMADLAPRDVVSRAIVEQQNHGHQVLLDASTIGPQFEQRFPTIYKKLKQEQINPVFSPIPVTPAAHFTIGGIKTDNYGRTNIPGLYACGEVASTGVHGANRLASNSLLEGMVFGKRIALALPKKAIKPLKLKTIDFKIQKLSLKDPRVLQLQTIMWTNVGIIRHEKGLLKAHQELEILSCSTSEDELELKNMILVAKLMTSAALNRLESRGSHFRLDYPQPDHNWQQKHLCRRRVTA